MAGGGFNSHGKPKSNEKKLNDGAKTGTKTALLNKQKTDLNTKKPASHVSVDYESKLVRLVDQNDSERQALDLQIALDGEGEMYRATDGEIIECDQEQADAIIR